MIDPTKQIFAVQDDTGTVALVFVENDSPQQNWIVGSQGLIAGTPRDTNSMISLAFRVAQAREDGSDDAGGNPALNGMIISAKLNDGSITPNADWPSTGSLITWTDGSNSGVDPLVVKRTHRANAYISVNYLIEYLMTRGVDIATLVPQSPYETAYAMYQSAIIKATDYLDQKYQYSGVKLLQTFGPSQFDANSVFLEAWLTPYAVDNVSYLIPTTSLQQTQWPRQGVVDLNGDTINGIPHAIQGACAELASRVLTGTVLQPDYDPGLVGAGGIVSSVTKKVGPLETIFAYDTKLGLGFFASFPIVDRMLSKAGLLASGGGRSVMR